MSMFGDYKAYKKYAPLYPDWKAARDLAESKRLKYLEQNPSEVNLADIQRSKALLRAVDAMDEYSQKRAEDMEVVTETVVTSALEIAFALGAAGAFLLTQLKPIKNFLAKHAKNNKKAAVLTTIGATVAGGLLGSLAAFPLYAWAAKAEVKASRKGRFESMRKELNDPKTFAVLTPEQEIQLEENLNKLSKIKEKKSPLKSIKESWNTLKEMAIETKEYKQQKMLFDLQLKEDSKHFEDELAPKEIETAKRHHQLLTKLVEKIDIASQDYAENAELATQAVIGTLMAMNGLFTFGYNKLAQTFKWKQSNAPALLSMALTVLFSMFSASIQKEASRVGRFKIKQELLDNPQKLVYVADEKTGEITDVEISTDKKTGIFSFLRNAYKNTKAYQKWKEKEGAKEKKLSEAMKDIELSESQLQEAKQLQHNTFKTFNKIDENSQKYSESIEALGQAIQYPIGIICSSIGIAIGMKYLLKMDKIKNAKDMMEPMLKYTSSIFLSTLPALGINAYITKEQKKASRTADMLAINEMDDYRHFAYHSNSDFTSV